MRAKLDEQREQLALHARAKVFLREILSTRKTSADLREGIFTALRAEIGKYCEAVLSLSWEESGVAYYFDYYIDDSALEQKSKEIDSLKNTLRKLKISEVELESIVEQFRYSLINLDESVNEIINYRLKELSEGRSDFSLSEFYKDSITNLSICSLGLLTSSSELSFLIENARSLLKKSNASEMLQLAKSGDIDYFSSSIWSSDSN